jgi:hypothetical protein
VTLETTSLTNSNGITNAGLLPTKPTLSSANRIKTWNVQTFRILYTTFVRPHLEYAASAWSPYHTKDIKLLEQVQRRATKLVKEFKHLPYAERLNAIGLTTLATRRTIGDLIDYFKIVNNLNIVAWHNPNPPNCSTRGHSLRTTRQITTFLPRNYFLSRGCSKM